MYMTIIAGRNQLRRMYLTLMGITPLRSALPIYVKPNPKNQSIQIFENRSYCFTGFGDKDFIFFHSFEHDL